MTSVSGRRPTGRDAKQARGASPAERPERQRPTTVRNPHMITVSDELKPCPFCGGPAVDAGGDYITCGAAWNPWCAGHMVKTTAEVWNTRATPITNIEATGDDVVQVAKALIVAEFPDNGGEALANSAQEGDWPMWQKAVAQARAAIATLSPNGVSQSAVEWDCPSCGGLNISCPEGCGRDPETGELDGSTLASTPDEGGEK